MNAAYDLRVSYHFAAGGSCWVVTDVAEDYLLFEADTGGSPTAGDPEEADSHMSGRAELVDGKWVISAGSRRSIGHYLQGYETDEISDYFNKHGAPSPGNSGGSVIACTPKVRVTCD